MALADLEHLRLDILGRRVGMQLGKLAIQVFERSVFHLGRRAALQPRDDEVARS
jgi:hypothetical protein